MKRSYISSKLLQSQKHTTHHHTMPLEIVVRDQTRIKSIKTQLEQSKNFVKPIKRESDCTIIRTNIDSLDQLTKWFPQEQIREYESALSNSSLQQVGVHDILGFTRVYFQDTLPETKLNEILEHVPLKYSIYPPVLLLNNSTKRSFDNVIWDGLLTTKFYHDLLKLLSPGNGKLRIVAINRPILEEDNLLRKPYNLEIIYSMDYPIHPELLPKDNVWCQVKQNGIWQVWNPFYTMFSRGNIKEKRRILDTFMDVEDNDVVDLYCGIGYFSLCYIHLKCRNLFGFELNPWSVEAFKRGLILNKHFGRLLSSSSTLGGDMAEGIHLYNENNEMSDKRLKEFCKSNGYTGLRIRHINMGLLPSSEQGYPVAIKLLENHHNWNECPKVTLHIHENASIEEIESQQIQDRVLKRLRRISVSEMGLNYEYVLMHLEKIKTFAPDIWHICLDVDIINASN